MADPTALDTTLLKLVDRAIDDDRFATDTVGIVLKELLKLGQSSPLLVGIDAYNAWLSEDFPNFRDFEAAPMTAERAALIRHFNKFVTGAAGGAHVGAVVLVESQLFADEDVLAQDPQLSASTVVGYTNFDQSEFEAYVTQHYKSGWLSGTPRTKTLESLAFLTNRNPHRLAKLLQSM
jgi:hypothetical protein